MKTAIQLSIFFLLFGCNTIEQYTIYNSADFDSSYPDCFDKLDTINLKNGFGCGSIFLFKELEEGIVTVNFDPNKVKMSSKCQTFELDNNIEIYLEIYLKKEIPKDSFRTIDFCGCMKLANAQKRIRIKADKGNLTASVKPSQNKVLLGEMITAELNSLEFKHPITGEIIKLDRVLFWNVNIGWFAG